MARLVFDLDGTLIDSVPDIHALVNRVTAARGLPAIDLPTTRRFVGRGASVFFDRLAAHLDLDDTTKRALLAEFLQGYASATGKTEIYPGVMDVLRQLQSAGHRLGLCTNKPLGPTRAVLAHFDLATFFEVVIGGDSLPVRKPDPAPLHAAFDALGEGPMIYVGDSETDADTAVAAEVPFLLFTQGYRIGPVESLPHAAAFDDWRDAPDLIAGLLQN